MRLRLQVESANTVAVIDHIELQLNTACVLEFLNNTYSTGYCGLLCLKDYELEPRTRPPIALPRTMSSLISPSKFLPPESCHRHSYPCTS